MKKQTLAALAALILFLGFAPSAWSVPMFARMYSYNCTMCHYPAYGQLNKFGWEFRDAGFRVPSEIGTKEPNDGKFEMGNYMTVRASGGVNFKSTSNAPISATGTTGPAVSDNGSFTLGSPSLFLGGAFGKNYTGFVEFSMGNGTGVFPGTAPSVSVAFVGLVTGEEHEYFTFRVGKFASLDGFSGSDRGPAGNPTINSSIKFTATGAEVGYTLHDTRIALAFFNGIQSPIATDLYDKGKPVTTTSLIGNTTDTNNAKDISLFVNQFIGEDGAAINAAFYNGFNGSGFKGTSSAVGDATGNEYYRVALWANSPVIKDLDVKVGGLYGQNDSGIFKVQEIASDPIIGGFAEVDYTLADLTPIAVRYDYNTTNYNVAHQETQKFTLGGIAPLIENVYFNPQYSLTLTSATLGTTYVHSLGSSLNVIF